MSKFEFKSSDIGSPAISGSTLTNDHSFEITAGGADIWGVSDQLHFAYTEYKGDFDFTAKLESFEMSHLYAKAGLMARETLEAGSPHVYHMVFPDNSPRNKNNGGYEFQYREVNNDKSYAIYPSDFQIEPPMFPVNYPNTWLRLKRIGNKFDAFYSPDGNEWTIYSSHTIELAETLLVGFAVTSHDTAKKTVAKFADAVLA